MDLDLHDKRKMRVWETDYISSQHLFLGGWKICVRKEIVSQRPTAVWPRGSSSCLFKTGWGFCAFQGAREEDNLAGIMTSMGEHSWFGLCVHNWQGQKKAGPSLVLGGCKHLTLLEVCHPHLSLLFLSPENWLATHLGKPLPRMAMANLWCTCQRGHATTFRGGTPAFANTRQLLSLLVMIWFFGHDLMFFV